MYVVRFNNLIETDTFFSSINHTPFTFRVKKRQRNVDLYYK